MAQARRDSHLVLLPAAAPDPGHVVTERAAGAACGAGCRLQAGSRGGGGTTVWREARCPGPCLAHAPSRHWAGRGQGPAGASQKSASSKTVTSLDTAAQGCGGAGPGSGLAPRQVVGPRSRGSQTHREGQRGSLREAHPRSEFHLFVDGNGPRAQGSGTWSRPGPRLAGSPLPTRRPVCAPSQEPRAQRPRRGPHPRRLQWLSGRGSGWSHVSGQHTLSECVLGAGCVGRKRAPTVHGLRGSVR